MSISIPESVSTLGENVFYECISLESVKLTNGCDTIGNYAFYKCSSLKEIYIPDTVEKIGERAFENCRALEKIELGKNVREIGYRAFANCISLKKAIFDGKVPDKTSEAIFEGSEVTVFYKSENAASWKKLGGTWYGKQVELYNDNEEILLGDVNGDGKVNSRDIAMLQREVLNAYLTEEKKVYADMNGDAKINSRDIASLQKLITS